MFGPPGPCNDPDHLPANLAECNFYSDDEGPLCNQSGEKCRYKYRVNCPRYISIYLYQVKCDEINGTHFAEQLLENRRDIPVSLH